MLRTRLVVLLVLLLVGIEQSVELREELSSVKVLKDGTAQGDAAAQFSLG